MDVRTLSDVTDFFVLCTAGSHRQLTAIQDQIERLLAEQGGAVWHTEDAAREAPGSEPIPQWLLMDCGDVVVHLLDSYARSLYRLEELWADAPRVAVASELSSPAGPSA